MIGNGTGGGGGGDPWMEWSTGGGDMGLWRGGLDHEATITESPHSGILIGGINSIGKFWMLGIGEKWRMVGTLRESLGWGIDFKDLFIMGGLMRKSEKIMVIQSL